MDNHLELELKHEALLHLQSKLTLWQQKNERKAATEGNKLDTVAPLKALQEEAESEELDDATVDALKAFQKDRNLEVTGLPTPEVFEALIEACWRLGDRLLWYKSPEFRGDDVLDLEVRLAKLGLLGDNRPTGIYTDKLASIVSDFQQQQGLVVDGQVGDATVRALMSAYRKHQTTGEYIPFRELRTFENRVRGGLTGLPIMIDPSSRIMAGYNQEETAALTWDIASLLRSRLSIMGAKPMLTRGPNNDPSQTTRAITANQAGAMLLVSLDLSRSDDPNVSGANGYFYCTPVKGEFKSNIGSKFASAFINVIKDLDVKYDVQGSHYEVCGRNWELLRATRMPAVIIEPGFISHAPSVERLHNRDWQIEFTNQIAKCIEETIYAVLSGEHY